MMHLLIDTTKLPKGFDIKVPEQFNDIEDAIQWIDEQRKLYPDFSPQLQIGDKVFDPLPGDK
jgi:hypothetical protein